MTDSEALEKLRDAVRVRHLAHSTEKAYAFWLQSYMGAVRAFPAEWSPEEKVERFLMDEARRGVSPSTQNQALNALVFFYDAVLKRPLAKIEAVRATRKPQIRVALEVGETRAESAGLN